jgi:hypothetical protein
MAVETAMKRSLRSFRSVLEREHLLSVLFFAEQTQHQFNLHALHVMWSHRSFGQRSRASHSIFLGSQPQRVEMTPHPGHGLYRSRSRRSELPDEVNNFQFKLSWLLSSA